MEADVAVIFAQGVQRAFAPLYAVIAFLGWCKAMGMLGVGGVDEPWFTRLVEAAVTIRRICKRATRTLRSSQGSMPPDAA